MRFEEMSIDEQAQVYYETIMGPTNGWGQSVHPEYGYSHELLYVMHVQHGAQATDAALDKVFGYGEK